MMDLRDLAIEVAELLDKDRKKLTKFRSLMMAYAEQTMRDSFVANDTNLLHAYRGQMRTFTELADRAKDALDAIEAKANAEIAEGIRLEPQ